VVALYYDPGWGNLWARCGDELGFLPVAAGVPIRSGDRVLIEGIVTPPNPLYANSATYTILERGVVETPIDARGRAGEYQALKGHLVTLRGVLNRQDLRESDHFVAHFVADGHVVHVYHWTPAPRAVEAQEGDIFEITGLYNPMHESRTETIEIDLWVRDISDIKVVGNLATEPRFEIPLTTIDEMPDQFNGDVAEVHIAGIVESHQPGKGFVVRDT